MEKMNYTLMTFPLTCLLILAIITALIAIPKADGIWKLYFLVASIGMVGIIGWIFTNAPA